MKKITRIIILNSASFLLVGFFYPGFSFEEIQILIFAAIFFGIVALIIKPVLKFLSLPLNLFTFGLFSLISGAIIIYLVSFFVEGFVINDFSTPRVELFGFFVPNLYLAPLLSALLGSLLVSWLSTLLRWVFH